MLLSPPELIRALSQPLDPVPADIEPALAPLEGIRAVIFDVYGTLIISASGDIGAAAGADREAALRSILRDLDIAPPAGSGPLTERLDALVAAEHERLRADGIDHPEVEIRDHWQQLLGIDRGPVLDAAAIAYECVTNPVWPMPGVAELLEALQQRGLALGLVSNAQFYTPLLFEAFFVKSLDELGFDPGLTFFSYRHHRAKPGLWLYEQLRAALAERSIAPAETLYLGNDALKDIHPAASLGFRTALFAGDARSLHLRPGHPGLLPPAAVVTSLAQVPALLA